MKIRKIIPLVLALLISFSSISCNVTEKNEIKPDISQMRSICELSVMKCYYHNVAKYKLEDAEGFWIWKKDKHFWIEYKGIVELGIEASLVSFDVKDTYVTITIPKAKVLNQKVDPKSLTQESFIKDKKSAPIKAEDEIKAFEEAEKNMFLAASQDTVLLASAQQRAQLLIEEYIKNIGKALGKEYSIKWIYIDSNSTPPKNVTVVPKTFS